MTKNVDFQGITVANPGFGAMGLSQSYGVADIEESKKTLKKAIEIGSTLWNTADVYGAGENEKLIGAVLKETGDRDKVFVVTKYGITPNGPDGSPEYAAKAIDASIERLGFAPDAWALHRIDRKIPIEKIVEGLVAAQKAGKTKFIGLSEVTADELRKAHAIHKIDFIEIEYSPWTLTNEKNGVLAAAKELGVVVLAYSPLGRGFLTGRYKKFEDFANEGDSRTGFPRHQKEVWEHNYKLVHLLEEFAAKKGATASQVALAWLIAQGDNIVPIPGTKSEKYLVENFNARDIELSDAELKELREIIDNNQPIGHRALANNQAHVVA
ncbi:hypothetical protein MNV49_001285 [Pseudohyphozyma bogoriensis]|nr:hypothetical protein MNV49_001285 [Pseudohyphozyma bogoriensis]